MPRYGTCSECGTSVWLTEDGACPQGHGPECISGIGETAAPQAPAPAGRKSNAAVIAIVVVIVLMCCLVSGILVAIAIPVFNAASLSARERACFAQQRVMEGALEQWVVSEDGRSRSDLNDYDALVDAIVPTYVSEEQVCPEGGSYEYDPLTGEVSCTLHGRYE